MRKTKTVARQETVECCDLCEREMGSWLSSDRCFLCGRAACHACRQWVSMTPDDARHLELGFKCCKECLAAGHDVTGTPFPDLIRQAVGESDRAVCELVDRWKWWAGDHRGKQAAREARP